jgi:hypothetical protein
MCRDALGNLYIGDGSAVGQNDARVRKITAATGFITTIAGGVYLSPYDTSNNVPATSVNINDAKGICIDKTGNLLIATGNHLKKVNLTTGIITNIVGTGATGFGGDGGPATAASTEATEVAVDTANNIYIADNCTVRKITASTGIINTVAGKDTAGFGGDGGPATAALLEMPITGLYVDSSGNIYRR